MKSYKDLDIYNLAYEYAIEVHEMTMKLPKYELYEQGSQIRRSSKRIKDTIAEGCGRRRYKDKDEFIGFLNFAHSSCDEAIPQLPMISELRFTEEPLYEPVDQYNKLGGEINKFIKCVEQNRRVQNAQPETRNS